MRQGKWSWLLLARAFVRVVIQQVGGEIIYLAIDDTLVLRSSEKAPASQIHHQHGNKPNLARFVRGQCWVTLAQIARREKGNNIAIPLLSRLMRTAGNTGKLRAAQTLIRSVSSLYSGKTVRLLMDSWYMRGDLILAMLAQEIDVIGQVRHDTRCTICLQPQRKTARQTCQIWKTSYRVASQSHGNDRSNVILIWKESAVAISP
ncbi:MAG: transposase [Cellvibrio sp.]|nr:transposase [Cellvibrio sp.]